MAATIPVEGACSFCPYTPQIEAAVNDEDLKRAQYWAEKPCDFVKSGKCELAQFACNIMIEKDPQEDLTKVEG
jgi:hypothetical protein